MADRYDEALGVLNETPAPDQWDETQRRAEAATATEAHVISLNGKRRRGQPLAGWPILTAAAAVVVLAVAGAMVLASRDTSSVTDTGPASEPQRPETSDTTDPPGTTTEPDTTTGTRTEREPEDESAPPPAPLPTNRTTPTDPSTTTGQVVTNCLDVEFRSNAPADLARVQGPHTPNDPRLTVDGAGDRLIGAFESSQTDSRVVFVVEGGGFAEDGGTTVPIADLEGDGWVAYSSSSGMGLVELVTTLNEVNICTYTFFSYGLGESELRAFVRGLGYAH